MEFSVRDTGIGIPASRAEQLFQPFAQADPSMSRRFGGTGLGLSISKSLVEMMGGRIWAESEAGKGSTFRFTVRLPLAKELLSDFEAPAVSPTAARGQLRVLLAEDNPANQKVATYILEDRGHAVEIAGDGQEAIRLYERNSYDVILMDVQMPGMDGLEATAFIRKNEQAGKRVPIIAMTAHAMREDRDRCLAAGMDGYLAKPVDAREMIALVEGLTAKSSSAEAVPVPPAPAGEGAEEVPSAVIFDAASALKRCFGKRELLDRVIRIFFEEVDNLLPQIRSALHGDDLTEVGALGHRLKGTISHLAAEPARAAARRVERAGMEGGTLGDAEEAVAALERECKVLRAALVEYQAAAAPSAKG
jgi:CheY-like chemotaxis protein/HPt (histidine-containing phosphotransfer) domain-containing protein